MSDDIMRDVKDRQDALTRLLEESIEASLGARREGDEVVDSYDVADEAAKRLVEAVFSVERHAKITAKYVIINLLLRCASIDEMHRLDRQIEDARREMEKEIDRILRIEGNLPQV